MREYLLVLVALLTGYAGAWWQWRWPDYKAAGETYGKILAATIKCRRRGHVLCECLEHCIDCSALAPNTSSNQTGEWIEFPTLPDSIARVYGRVATWKVTGKWS
jgi:hypothetical protein